MSDMIKNLRNKAASTKPLTRISISRGATEVVQQGAVIGTLMFADSVLKGPLEPVTNYVANHIILPNLKNFEKGLSNLPSLQTPEDAAQLEGKSDAERAKIYAQTLVRYSLSLGVGVAAQTKGQELIDGKFNVPDLKSHDKHGYWKITAVDRGVQLGSIVALNTVAAKPSIAMQNTLQKVLTGAGFSDEKADEMVTYGVNWMLPNIAGMAAAIAAHHSVSSKMPWR